MGIYISEQTASIKNTILNGFTQKEFNDYLGAYKAPQETLFLYDMLSESAQIQVSNLVYDLMEITKKTFVGALLKQQLEENEVSYTELANYLSDFLLITENGYKKYQDGKNLASKLQRFTKNKTVNEDNIWFDYVCDFINLSKEALCTGRGKYYELKEDKLDKLIKNKYPYSNKPKMRFAQDILKKHFVLADYDKECYKQDMSAISYFENCNRLIAKYAAEEFNVKLTDILEEKECILILSSDTLATIYNSLGSSEQSIIDRFLIVMYGRY